jgi:hypothetical protein
MPPHDREIAIGNTRLLHDVTGNKYRTRFRDDDSPKLIFPLKNTWENSLRFLIKSSFAQRRLM